MLTAAILGCAGYTGQETLDRVLNHPGLEPVALGSDSQAGQPAVALDPRLRNGALPAFVTNDEAAASGADVIFWCLSNERAAALDPPDGGVVVDLSGAHRIADTSLDPEWYGFEHPKPEGARLVLRPARAAAADGRLIANPGCYATAALSRSRRCGTSSTRRASSSTRSRASPAPAARRARRRTPARCSRTSRRTRSAGTGTCPRCRCCSASRRLRAAPAADAPRAARDLLRARRLGRRRARAARGGVRRLAGRAVLPEGVVPEIGASCTPTPSSSASSPTRRAAGRS